MDVTTRSDATISSPEDSARLPKGSLPDRPCDVCRKRKSRCVKELGQNKCVLCTFHQRDCTYLDAPARRKRKRRDEAELESPSIGAASVSSPNPGHSLLNSTLGLHRTSHSRFVGSSSVHEPVLWALQEPYVGTSNHDYVRRVDANTFFVTENDHQTPFHVEELTDIDEIERTVQPNGPKLVEIYFRIVHPVFPILHKAVFLEKYARSYREFSPPLLAAVYLLAMDWWEYDTDLSQKSKPDGSQLLRLATNSFTSVVLRPKLSTVQAGLLLLQRYGGGSWIMTSQVVAVAEELGLHQDCSSWSVPDWEIGLRRRLAWAVIMQDCWAAALYGRPPHVSLKNWSARRVSLNDFPETAADQDNQDGSTEVEKGRRLFIHLAALTEILAEIQGICGPSGMSPTVSALEELLTQVKPVAMRLRDWKASMPAGLYMEDVTPRKLCSNGYLHLAYYTVEILLHRHIIRCCSVSSDPTLVSLCREAAKLRLEHAVSFVDMLRPEHLHAFWWFASAESVVLIGTYNALLWATSPLQTEADTYKNKLDEFRWSLKLRATNLKFVTIALQQLDKLPTLDDRLRQSQVLVTSQAGVWPSRLSASTMIDEDTPQQTPSHFQFDWNAFDEAFSPYLGPATGNSVLLQRSDQGEDT
ncbi:uncharacterized protein HMPREF1541_01855 [Cyphellophora europaea CBS 101466]|uniref:Zn(2)-C6 fungal-type domain-containing protein n=1 Tax=Cyphellophora europaea (strain CBS 101466) TaxID=1220924 RepID=W2S1Y6_CYPE1|nr:uncharacterized protein HMPREF1541_01855 [Cyphellophora europaea CBS 101466]ETN42697.1 hypothetical protein HMPREF1541_01855 [Cyphellophora europaea CBS 101466]